MNTTLHSKKSAGLSLLEVMIALTIFALVSIGISAMVIQGQKLAHENILRNSAYTVAQGYLEQIVSINSADILEAANDPTISIPTVSVSALNSGEGNIEIADPLFVGTTNNKQILIDQKDDDEGNPVQYTLDMSFDVTITDLNDAVTMGANAIPAIQITLDFTYESRQLRGTSQKSGTLRIVKLNMSV